MAQKFYQCKICGNMIGKISGSGAGMTCCGEAMTELIANTVEASQEKHLPAVTKDDCGLKVNVGSVDHPMGADHHISFIYVETKNGGQRRSLAIDSAPAACFCECEDEAVAVYAYCNLHGLWKVDL